MLAFFIHGVATRDVKYSQSLIEGIKQEFVQNNEKLPYFYTSFWGHVLSDFNRIWNHIDDDLISLKQQDPSSDPSEAFRYRKFREGLISEFTGDMFTYMNKQQGYEVRKLIADQILKFVQKHPEEKEICIISHSLGTVILWDILFSDNFDDNDPAHSIRKLLSSTQKSEDEPSISLAGIVTMGSPILFFNAMLGIDADKIKVKINDYTSREIQWTNIVHASDIIAYPLSSSLRLDADSKLVFQDIFLCEDANLIEKAARKLGQQEVALIAGMVDAHTGYWSSKEVAQIASRILQVESDTLKEVTRLLKQVPGMGKPTIKLHSKEYVVEMVSFHDGSGHLKCKKNLAQVHHVYVYNSYGSCIFTGYVDWTKTNNLLQAIQNIRFKFGKPDDSMRTAFMVMGKGQG
jgi:hypothetical protein